MLEEAAEEVSAGFDGTEPKVNAETVAVDEGFSALLPKVKGAAAADDFSEEEAAGLSTPKVKGAAEGAAVEGNFSAGAPKVTGTEGAEAEVNAEDVAGAPKVKGAAAAAAAGFSAAAEGILPNVNGVDANAEAAAEGVEVRETPGFSFSFFTSTFAFCSSSASSFFFGCFLFLFFSAAGEVGNALEAFTISRNALSDKFSLKQKKKKEKFNFIFLKILLCNG